MYVLKMPSVLLLLVILSLSLTHSFTMTMAASLDLSSLFTPKSKISGPSVVVLGGNGFVGSRVCKYLVEQDCKVTSISRRGTPPDWAAGEEWTDTVTWKAGDCYDADATIKLMRGNSVVVSCLGVIGFDNDALESGNGDLNVAALTTAKRAGINKAVYVSVASLVEEAFGDKLLTGYFKGKRTANALVSDLFKNNGKIVKPSFIYGGDKFELSPPRVPYGYGGFISKLLSAGPIQAIAEKSPAPLAVVLAPPVNVDDVAKSVVGLALGKVSGTNVDGTTEIEEAAAAI